MITFRVPTESASASTTGLKVQFPVATPIASVLVQPQPGWTYTAKSTKLTTPIKTDDGDITEAVSEIDWSATSAAQGIKPGEFGEFVVIAGQLPDAPSITFKAIQAYSDGSQVDWIDVPAPGSSAEPEHPAPVLQLAPRDQLVQQSVGDGLRAAGQEQQSDWTRGGVRDRARRRCRGRRLGGLAFSRARGRRT